jgi:hypothetical protein
VDAEPQVLDAARLEGFAVHIDKVIWTRNLKALGRKRLRVMRRMQLRSLG